MSLQLKSLSHLCHQIASLKLLWYWTSAFFLERGFLLESLLCCYLGTWPWARYCTFQFCFLVFSTLATKEWFEEWWNHNDLTYIRCSANFGPLSSLPCDSRGSARIIPEHCSFQCWLECWFNNCVFPSEIYRIFPLTPTLSSQIPRLQFAVTVAKQK